MRNRPLLAFFFFNDTATTEIYTLSLHDALPICLGQLAAYARRRGPRDGHAGQRDEDAPGAGRRAARRQDRSEEHTSELQSHLNLVCRLLLEKKNSPSFSQTLQIPRYQTSDQTRA